MRNFGQILAVVSDPSQLTRFVGKSIFLIIDSPVTVVSVPVKVVPCHSRTLVSVPSLTGFVLWA